MVVVHESQEGLERALNRTAIGGCSWVCCRPATSREEGVCCGGEKKTQLLVRGERSLAAAACGKEKAGCCWSFTGGAGEKRGCWCPRGCRAAVWEGGKCRSEGGRKKKRKKEEKKERSDGSLLSV